MKSIFFSTALCVLSAIAASGQCPPGGLNIQSDACVEPQNLKVVSISCSEIIVAWTGKKEQAYVLKMVISNPTTFSAPETRAWRVSTDELGNARVKATVKEGYHATWSIQTICQVEDAQLNSAEVAGAELDIPVCQKNIAIRSSSILSVYPNPSKDNLLVEYKSKGGGAVVLEVFSLSGTSIISRIETAVENTKSIFQINIGKLSPGTYLLKATNEKDGVSQVKFIKI